MRAFYEPVALTHPEISDIARALNVMQRSPIHSSGVYWCRCPAGVTPDLYVSHLRNVELEDDDAWDADSADISPSAHGKPCPPRLLLDAQGMHAGRPVCLLGEEEDSHHAWQLRSANQAVALHRLMSQSAQLVLAPMAMQFDLARQMICLRNAWPEHHLIWKMHDSPEMLAIATVRTRKIWQLQDLDADALKRASIQTWRYTQPLSFDACRYQPLSLWQVLWNYVQRCPLSVAHTMCTPRLQEMTVRLHRIDHLPAHGLGHIARTLLHQVQAGPKTASALMQWQNAEPEDLLRALMGLLFIRVFTADPFDDPECNGSGTYGCSTPSA